MSEADPNDITCLVAMLAAKAAHVIPRLDVDESAQETIFAIEELACEIRAKSKEAAAFQLALIPTLADAICTSVPGSSPALAEAEAALTQIHRLVRSISAVLGEPATPAERVIYEFYFA